MIYNSFYINNIAVRIYFSATITKNDELRDLYTSIIDALKKEGHKVFEYGSSELDPAKLINRSENEIAKAYNDLSKFLKQADIFIADISESSVGIGYEIAQALSLKKPALVLKHKDAKFEPLATLEGNKSKLLQYEQYEKTEIAKIINTFVKESKSKLDTKFILIISPEIDRYLEWAAEHRRMHKAQIVRQAVEDMMRKDKDYKEVYSDL